MTYSRQKVVSVSCPTTTYSYNINWSTINGVRVYTYNNYNSTNDRRVESLVCNVTCGENPRFREDIREGRCATTVLSGGDLHLIKYKPGRLESTRSPPVNGGTFYHLRTGKINADFDLIPGSASGISSTSADNQAKTRFLNKLVSAQTSFHSGVFLGELRETIRMLRRPAAAIRRRLDWYYGASKERTKRLKEAQANRVVSETWLEVQYGIKPFISDVDDALEAISRFDRKPHYQPVRAGGESEDQDSNTSSNYTTGGLNAVRYVRISRKATVAYFGYVDCTRAGSMSGVRHELGIHLAEFVPTVYNLIPYSFLVDYFTNLGDIIEGVSYRRTGLAWCQKTVRKAVRKRVTHTIVGPTSGWSMGSCSPMESDVERTQVDRSVYTGDFIPSVEFNLPGVSDGKWKRWFNIAALAELRRLR